MHDLISLTKVNGTYCSRGCFRVRLKPVFLLKQRRGRKGGTEGANLKPKAISSFFFSFMSWHYQTCGCTIASLTPKQHVQLYGVRLPCSSPCSYLIFGLCIRVGVLGSPLVCLQALSKPPWEPSLSWEEHNSSSARWFCLRMSLYVVFRLR